MTCGKTQGFLANRKLAAAEEINAKKSTLGAKDALRIAREADVIYAARGKKVVRIDVRKDKPDDAALKAVMLGPTGNLRAPTLRVGRTLIVGFDEETYKKFLL